MGKGGEGDKHFFFGDWAGIRAWSCCEQVDWALPLCLKHLQKTELLYCISSGVRVFYFCTALLSSYNGENL